MVASVSSYLSAAVATSIFGAGMTERKVGKLTSVIMNNMLFAQGWHF